MCLRISFLLAACAAAMLAQDPLITLPKNYRLVFENDAVRVIHVSYAPHEKLPAHDHPKTPTVYVYLNDSGATRFTHVEEHPFTSNRPPETTGTFRMSPGRIEKHEVENVGDTPSEFLRVELKQIPLQFQPNPFRSAKNYNHSRSGVTTEFTSPWLQVMRIVAVKDRPTVIPSSAGLVVAITPASVGSRSLKNGDVVWEDSNSAARASAASDAPADLLYIGFSGKQSQ